MPTSELVLSTLANEYPAGGQADAYLTLYKEDPPLNAIFASFHSRLNELFHFLNVKQDRGGHYNAEQSRELLDLLSEIREVRTTLARVSIKLDTNAEYQAAIDECSAFLVRSGGSPIPEGLKMPIERFEPVFSSPDDVSRPDSARVNLPKPVQVGEGAFALVYKYTDEVYGFKVAMKVAKRNISTRDLERFNKEFGIMKSLSFPYIVDVYSYDNEKNQYTMEYCDSTLDAYIRANNDKMTWSTRKRVALQFLYAINYLHLKNVMHRDISRRNVLIKQYDLGAVVVKLSDFGLYKGEGSEYTQVDSSLKGTIIDPTLSTFKDFDYTNDIYAVGLILTYIFTGKAPLNSASGAVELIVAKCTDYVVANRFASVVEIIAAVDSLPTPVERDPAETPA